MTAAANACVTPTDGVNIMVERRPRRPAWHIAAERRFPVRRRFIEVDHVQIEYLSWGQAEQPKMLLLHGAGANADWWHATAMLLADSFHIIAPSYSGCGNSGWRDLYGTELFVEEAAACLTATDFLTGNQRLVCVAHSFGSEVGLRLAATRSSVASQLILVDTVIGKRFSRDLPPYAVSAGSAPQREQSFYDSVAEGIGRYHTVPRDAFGDPFYRYEVARKSLRRSIPPFEKGRWTWSADPNIAHKTAYSDGAILFPMLRCPVDFLFGSKSTIGGPEVRERQRELAGNDASFSPIEEAGHHIPLDQPQALAKAIRILASAH